MIESVTCDLEDGRVGYAVINIKTARGTVQVDVCEQHYKQMVKNGHKPVRGRRPGSTTRKSAARKTAATKKPVAGRRKAASRRK